MGNGCGFADPHFHPNPIHGDDIGFMARKFKEYGGWFAGIVSLPPWNYGLKPSWDSYLRVLDMIEGICDSFEATGVKAYCFSGFHPAEVDKLIDVYGMKLEDVIRLGVRVIEEVARRCIEGKIKGIGEVGRQHYKTFPDRAVASELILEHALELSRDYGCPVQMHLENTKSTVHLIKIITDRLGIHVGKREVIVFHHAKPSMLPEIAGSGFSVTVPGTRKPILEHLYTAHQPVFMVESDYVGGSKNPSNTVPWRMFPVVRQVFKDEEYLCRVMYDNVVRAFHVDI